MCEFCATGKQHGEETPSLDDMISATVEDIIKGFEGAEAPAGKEPPNMGKPRQPATPKPSVAEFAEALSALTKLFGTTPVIQLAMQMMTVQADEELVLDARIRKIGEPDVRPYDYMGDIRRWNEAAGQKRWDELSEDEKVDSIFLRRDLLEEEYEEVDDELRKFAYSEEDASREKLALELGDLLVIAYGTAYQAGIDLPGVYQAIMRKNWEKINPETGKPYKLREDGKVGKPDGFVPLKPEDVRKFLY